MEVRLPAAQFFHFANVRQNPSKFAKHWQIHPPRGITFATDGNVV
jgi:hypothetical protein